MNSKHRKTLEAIFKTSTPTSVVFEDVVSLVVGLGGQIVEGDGSRVSLCLSGTRKYIHRPHPGKEIKRYAVREIRDWLKELEIKP